jgi:hypothetical protein
MNIPADEKRIEGLWKKIIAESTRDTWFMALDNKHI